MVGRAISGKHVVTCNQFLEGKPVPAPLFISKEHTILMTGALLAHKDVDCAILMEKGEVKHAIYGYHIVNFLLNAPREKLYLRLFEPALNAKQIAPGALLPVMKLTDPCRKALGALVATRFGNLLFTDPEGRPVGLLSLDEMLRAMEGKTKEVGLKLREIASPLILGASEQSILDVFKNMMTNRVRRVVVKKNQKYYSCTERDILKALFSPKGLESIRDEGAKFLSKPVWELPEKIFRTLATVKGEIDVARAWTFVVANQSPALVVDSGMIVTPWDLVIKPFLAQKIPF